METTDDGAQAKRGKVAATYLVRVTLRELERLGGVSVPVPTIAGMSGAIAGGIREATGGDFDVSVSAERTDK